MNVLGNPFVRKAIKSMLTPEQYQIMESFMTAAQNGKIDLELAKRVGDKVSKMTPEEVNSLMADIDKKLKSTTTA